MKPRAEEHPIGKSRETEERIKKDNACDNTEVVEHRCDCIDKKPTERLRDAREKPRETEEKLRTHHYAGDKHEVCHLFGSKSWSNKPREERHEKECEHAQKRHAEKEEREHPVEKCSHAVLAGKTVNDKRDEHRGGHERSERH